MYLYGFSSVFQGGKSFPFHSDLMFLSVVMLRLLGQYMHDTWLCVSNPIHLPSLMWPSSFGLLGSCTQTRSPHSCSSLRSGFSLVSASYGVQPRSDLIDVQFVSQTTCMRASPQSAMGNWLACRRAWTLSISVWFSLSTMPFSSRVSCEVSRRSVPCLARWALKALLTAICK